MRDNGGFTLTKDSVPFSHFKLHPDLLKGLKAKINLIVWNPGPGIPYHQPSPEDVDRFHKSLIAGGIPTFIRRPRGRDIYAACGQLKRTIETDPAPPAPLVEIAPAATPPA